MPRPRPILLQVLCFLYFPYFLYFPPPLCRIVSLSMVSYDDNAAASAPSPSLPDHKSIGLCYLWLALASVLIGMFLSLLMRVHLVWPGIHIPFLSTLADTPGRYAALTLLHGSLMVFFVLTTAPQAGFGNYFLPLQIGARDMAFPVLNLFSFRTTALSLVGVTLSFFLPSSAGLTLWTASVALFCCAGLLTSINFAVTALDLRAHGMTLPRMPLTVWAWLINSILSMLIFSILLAACAFLLADRALGAQFFPPLQFLAAQPAPLAQSSLFSPWQRLFWFFAQAEVYVAMLPCFGIVSHLLSTFSRKRVWAERAAVLALCAVGLFGFCVWGQHMFSSGLNPWSPLVFSLLASSLGLPAFVLVCSWFGTLWHAKTQLNTAMLFALGFVSLFLAGGVSGIFLAGNDLAAGSVSSDLVTGHFHLVMGVAATFAILAAFFFWFPKMFGRLLNEPLGKLHFWLTFAGVYCVFMPMHWLGLVEHSRPQLTAAAVSTANVAQTAPFASQFIADPAATVPFAASLRTFIAVAAILTVAAQSLFLFNFLWSLFRGEKTEAENPWRATTLEWAVASPPPHGNFGARDPVVFRSAYEFNSSSAVQDSAPQNLATAPWEQGSRAKQATPARSAEK